MNSNINVVIASDDNYSQHMGIVILSCLTNTSVPDRLVFYLLSSDISDNNKLKIQDITQKYHAKCVFIEPDATVYGDIPKKRYGVAALFRLSISSLLPDDILKVIYLDCDVLFYSDIKELWEMEMDECVAGAVTNLGHQPVDRLEIDNGEYFNSGVLLINLEKWREQEVGRKTLEYMNKNASELLFPDQDGLNIALKNSWKHLPLRWNQQPATYSMYSKSKYEKSLTHEDYHDAIVNPGIVHFLGKNKPWTYLSYHPLKETYQAYIRLSPWAGFRPDDYNLLNMVIKWLSVEKNIKRLYRRFIVSKVLSFPKHS